MSLDELLRKKMEIKHKISELNGKQNALKIL